MRKNSIIALCVVILVLSLTMQRMTSQLGQTVPKLSEQTRTLALADLKTHFASQEVKLRTPGKVLLVTLKEPFNLPTEADLNWLRDYFLQKPDFQSFQKYELRYERGGNKGNFSGVLREATK
ncbi:hypothetical protein [Deinococcus cellulosilyticus]|uniref:Uncharacterized protein n=1 Tax=Deinococcus cellulosilyticus (strain DSM 18568 / NBRC 106333 / KACC 11606 / 5516J-15) TaxID=1223518 RepID=A0A511N2P2_DEIC1|nr:hypothetical protein [Deinococcus cellulosilyticus]GEM47102.1 hypothetical protein DC3_27370 [Deinococcus cellulosilyticus NBRC 106333 = KACC 11606]